MTREIFDTGKMPHLLIKSCGGDLVIRSWADSQVQLKGEDVNVEQSDAGLTLSSGSGLSLRAPEAATISAETVHGDLVIKNVAGEIQLTVVHGDVVLSGVGPVNADTIHSDLSAKNLNGSFQADAIAGDAVFRNVADVDLTAVHGDVVIRNVNGDINLQDVSGDVSVRTVTGDFLLQNGQRDVILRNMGGEVLAKRVDGDVRLYGGLSATGHTLTAAGDIVVRWPADAPLNLTASAPKISNRLPLENVVEEDGKLVGQLGDGQTALSLKADGRILLKEANLIREEWEQEGLGNADFEFAFDLEGLGERITAQVNEQVARVTSDLEAKFGPDFASRLTEKVIKKAERAASRAEKAAERARQRAERRSGYRRPTPPKPPKPPKSQATPEEQMKILKMVEQGLITPEEANTLLEALEG